MLLKLWKHSLEFFPVPQWVDLGIRYPNTGAPDTLIRPGREWKTSMPSGCFGNC